MYNFDHSIQNLKDAIRSGNNILSTKMRETAIDLLADRYAANINGEPRDEKQVAAYLDNLYSMSDEALIQEFIDNDLM